MYFKFTFLLISSVLIVNPVVGPKGKPIKLKTEDEVLDGYFGMVLEKVNKPSTSDPRLTKMEFVTFASSIDGNIARVQKFLDEFNGGELLNKTDACIDNKIFASLVKEFCPAFGESSGGFSNKSMWAWNNKELYPSTSKGP